MKSLTLVPLLLAGIAQSAIIPQNAKAVDFKKIEEKRQILGTLTWLAGKGGKVPDPPGAGPRRVEMKTTSTVPGVRKIKMRYGPYSVPNMNKTGLTGEPGSLWNFPDTAIPKPCTQCTIVSQQAGLEYPDGSNANIDSGMWLHHMVHLTIGPTREDATCFGKTSLPHFDVGSTPKNSERYFSSGNERTHVDIGKMGLATKYGYHLRAQDRFAFIVDLMNMNMEDKTVYVTMSYDIIEGPLPEGWKEMKVVWFDANQCGTSEVHPPKQSGQFIISSKTWKPNFDGEILGVGGHVHDGGAVLKVHVNGESNCDSTAKYGEKPEFMFTPPMKMGAAMGVATAHISSMKACYFDEMKTRKLDPEQVWQIKAHYDYDLYQGNKDEAGKQESIMAIALMYVAVEPNTRVRGPTPPPAPMGMNGTSDAQAAPGAPARPQPRPQPKAPSPLPPGFPPTSDGQGAPRLPKGLPKGPRAGALAALAKQQGGQGIPAKKPEAKVEIVNDVNAQYDAMREPIQLVETPTASGMEYGPE